LNKSSISLVAFVAILFTIGVAPYLTQDVFAHSAVVSAYTANDPDDGDTLFGAGDTLTITTSTATNATVGVVTDAAFVTGNFTFAVNPLATFTTDWTAEWTDASTLVITIVNPAAATPVVGVSTVVVTGGNTIGESGNPDDLGMTGAADTLAGDFGLFVAVTTSSNGSGCNGDCTEPTLGVLSDGRRIVDNGFSYNGKSVDVEYYFTPYPLVTVNVGKQNVAEFKIYDNLGIDNIRHFELAFGLASGESIGMSKAAINWDKTYDGIETVTIDDPENVLDKVKVTTSEGYCSDESKTKCLIVKVVHTFRAPLDFNILGTNVWDTKRNAWNNYFNHGIEVVGESLNPPKEYEVSENRQLYHLTETSKTSAVDEFGNSWSLKYGLWAMDYVKPERIVDSETDVFTRTHSEFAEYKDTQANDSIEQLLVLCPTCLMSYADFEDSFGYEYQEVADRIESIAHLMVIEERKAIQVLKSSLLEYEQLEIDIDDRPLPIILAEERQMKKIFADERAYLKQVLAPQQ